MTIFLTQFIIWRFYFLFINFWVVLKCLYISSVQVSSVAQSCLTLYNLWPAARQASRSITNFQSFLKLMSIELMMPSNYLILCHPLLLPPSTFPSIGDFSKDSLFHIRWLKYLCFSFSISPSNEYSRLISFKMDWLDLFAVQGTLKSLLQHHSSKAPILRRFPTNCHFEECTKVFKHPVPSWYALGLKNKG